MFNRLEKKKKNLRKTQEEGQQPPLPPSTSESLYAIS